MTDGTTTAELLGSYQKQLLAQDIDHDVVATLVIEAARHEINQNELRV